MRSLAIVYVSPAVCVCVCVYLNRGHCFGIVWLWGADKRSSVQKGSANVSICIYMYIYIYICILYLYIYPRPVLLEKLLPPAGSCSSPVDEVTLFFSPVSHVLQLPAQGRYPEIDLLTVVAANRRWKSAAISSSSRESNYVRYRKMRKRKISSSRISGCRRS